MLSLNELNLCWDPGLSVAWLTTNYPASAAEIWQLAVVQLWWNIQRRPTLADVFTVRLSVTAKDSLFSAWILFPFTFRLISLPKRVKLMSGFWNSSYRENLKLFLEQEPTSARITGGLRGPGPPKRYGGPSNSQILESPRYPRKGTRENCRNNNTGTMTMSMMLTMHVYVYVCFSKQASLARVLALKWHIGRSINVCYQSQTQSLSLEMNQYFVVIAYSNNVYFLQFRGTLYGGHPKNFFWLAIARHIFRSPIICTLYVIRALVTYPPNAVCEATQPCKILITTLVVFTATVVTVSWTSTKGTMDPEGSARISYNSWPLYVRWADKRACFAL